MSQPGRPAGYRLVLFDDRDEIVGDALSLPTIPAAGSVILHAGETWRVGAIQIMPAAYGSPAYRDNADVLVDVRVSRVPGIHD